jgi:hypothetical protein
MTELSGTLDGVGLPAIVRFLTGLRKTGCLRIVHNEWRGEIFFDQGQVTGATLASRHGLTALDALVQALPGGDFTFDGAVSGTASREASISLSSDALQGHLDDLASSATNGTARLPSFDWVAAVDDSSSSSTEETVPLDRGTLQTLLAVDGRRTVEEIVKQRGSLDVLWQLAHLVEVGLVSVGARAAVSATPVVAEPAAVEPNPDQTVRIARTAVEAAVVEPIAAEPAPVAAEAEHIEPIAAEPEPERPTPIIARPFAVEPIPVVAAEVRDHCPKLGFEDDPDNAFGRPTRMHRCFAAGTPLPLSLDQQRELCLSSEYGTCPRLTMSASAPESRPAQRPADMPGPRRPGPGLRRPEPDADDPRIVRLPIAGRASAAERGAVADRQVVGGPERNRFRSAAVPARESAQTTPSMRPTPSTPPTPLRSRLERANGSTDGAVAESPPIAAQELGPTSPRSAFQDAVTSPLERRFRGIPIVVIAGGAVVLVVLALVAYLLGPRLGDLFVDDSVDPSKMPNTSAVAAGTPIAALTGPRATAIARATATASALAAGAPAAAAPVTSDAPAAKPTITAAGAASAASASNVAPAPTLPPEPAQTAPQSAPAKPAVTGSDVAAPSSSGSSSTAPAAAAPAGGPASGAAQPAAGTLLDERFANNDRNWPSAPQGTAYLTNSSYRLATRQVGQFVAVGAPIVDTLKDVIVNASFHKLSGPSGGGYGIIVRDQASAPQNGTSQVGRYYVLEAGDNGEVGMWRRDGDQWTDLLPWQPNPAVKTGLGSNDLSVRAVGNRLSLTVNGTLVATKTDDTFAAGGVGVFVGGDGNQVAVDRFSIQTP